MIYLDNIQNIFLNFCETEKQIKQLGDLISVKWYLFSRICNYVKTLILIAVKRKRSNFTIKF